MSTYPNRPADGKRFGGVTATVWPNETDEGRTGYSVTITRSYRLPPEQRERGDNGWRDAGSLRRDDLLPTGELLRWAYDRIRQLEQTDRDASREGVSS